MAKVTRNDLLYDIHSSLVKSKTEGTPFNVWQKELTPELAKKGWLGKTEVIDPKTGEVKTINVNNARLRTIYNTNMKVASAVSRYNEMMSLSRAVYWQYIAVMDNGTRDEHAALNGIIRHRDDSLWSTHYPPNGWGCRCKVIALTLAEAIKAGYSPDNDNKAVETEPHPDWNFNVGKTDNLLMTDKIDFKYDLKAVKEIKRDPQLKDLSDDKLKDIFYARLGVKAGDTFIDKIGDPIIINDEIFKTGNKFSKIKKRDRHLYLNNFAEVIKDPDEIYLEFENLNADIGVKYINPKNRLMKKFIKYYKTEKNEFSGIIAIFDYQRDKTQSASIYFNKNIDKKRTGKLIYKK